MTARIYKQNTLAATILCSGKKSRCHAISGLRNDIRTTGSNDFPAFFARAGADIDDPIALADHPHVVLDHNYAVARGDQRLKLRKQTLDIGRMQAGCRFVKNVEGATTLSSL